MEHSVQDRNKHRDAKQSETLLVKNIQGSGGESDYTDLVDMKTVCFVFSGNREQGK